MTDQLGEFRAPDALVERYHAAGLWRSEGPIADLRRWRRERPDATAIIHYRDGVAGRLSWREYATYVERFAGALGELGVGPGDRVAVWLPNVWQVSALMLACARLGAVTVPLLPTLRARELSRIFARVEPKVCITIDSWAGFDHAAALELLAPPSAHRVGLDFFERSSATVDLDPALEDPDRLALIFFTSGTSGEPKGVLHSFNTIYAGIRPIAEAENIGPDDTMFIPHALTFIGGTLYGITMPLLAGAASVILDRWTGEAGVRLLRETGTTVMFAAPTFLHDILARSPGPLPALRLLVTGATTIPQRLVREMPAALGLPLRTLWGMTEVAAQTWTRASDPDDWGAYSDGSPGSGLSIDLRSSSGPVSREQPARLFVRGAGVTLATLGRDSGDLNVLAAHDDGWYDTGDHAIPDGRGGIRIIGRVADRIGGLFMIPVNDVESQLLEHPAIDDVAVVGFGDDQACAVIVSAAPPSLAEIQAFLTAAGMTDWYQPVRLEVVDKLPRNSAGKVRKDLLRRWLTDGTWGTD
ncbi:AMP-binding protein [Actinoplanes sp. TBRC 11911]|uniref:AMP-binding protein n=1 Tax=Actinoplanes sp. TBRC 11911 TaxID=2729386 RepID=UPI00145DEAD3|nr:AMP-binding protein [Actinoplanes sp. TBRC 11911]NMO54029.1 AMP-binding protein [Actinoplanes sp. TBRC 11911]